MTTKARGKGETTKMKDRDSGGTISQRIFSLMSWPDERLFPAHHHVVKINASKREIYQVGHVYKTSTQ